MFRPGHERPQNRCEWIIVKKNAHAGQVFPTPRRVQIPRPVWLDRDSARAGGPPSCLFGFNRELRPVPLVPATLERIDVGKTLVDQLLWPPSTGKLIWASAVQEQGFGFGVCGGLTFGRVRGQ